METKLNIGIWMDHASAHVMEFTTDPINTKIIISKFTHQSKMHSLNKNENLMHNKEQHQHSEFYKSIADQIIHCKEVVLFGPTNAKSELLNILRDDHRFEKIKIEVKQTDKMTENQQHAFVKEYYNFRK